MLAVEQPECGLTLRLSANAEGAELWPTPAEQEAEGRRIAEQRVLEREAELRWRSP